LAAALLLLTFLPLGADEAEDLASEQILARWAQMLSADDMEGRGVETQGLERASQLIADEFKRLGLKTDLWNGEPFQNFTITVATNLGQSNSLAFVGPEDLATGQPARLELMPGADFTPLAIGGGGEFDIPLVFAGYGITAPDIGYDDYAGVDVAGKAVVIFRHEPQQQDPHSLFEGTENSAYAPFREKVSNAFQHGAACVIICNDSLEIENSSSVTRRRWQAEIDLLTQIDVEYGRLRFPTAAQTQAHRRAVQKQMTAIAEWDEQLQRDMDPVFTFTTAGNGSDGRTIPVLFCRREWVNAILSAALGKDIAALEQAIDAELTPQSAELPGWRALGKADVNQGVLEVKNVAAVLEGEGPLANETIIIGAHYDHVGYGGQGSRSPGVMAIHNGADDNASGTSAVIEIARRLSQREEKLPRRIVFMLFSAEERGLLGSAHYVREPLFPLDGTIAMLNLDMVGRLRDGELTVHGTGSAAEFDALVDRVNESVGLTLFKDPSGTGPSDHASFYGKQIPVFHFFTGYHDEYHRPEDDFPLINVPGIRQVADLAQGLAVAIAEEPSRPTYQATGPRQTTQPAAPTRPRPYFGSIPDFAPQGEGYSLSGVTDGSPAAAAGLQAGDRIVQLGESRIGNLEDFDSVLRRYDAGDVVGMVVIRDGQELNLEIELGEPRE
jgi:hypothetical protein